MRAELQADAPEDDLRSDLEAQFTAAESAEAVVEAPEVEVTAEAPAEIEEKPAVERARAPDGKFAPKESTEAPVEAATEQKSASTDTQAKASETAASTPQDAPPVGWTPDAKAEWSKLSPAIKAAVIKRETEIANGGRQWSEEKRRYEAAISPIAQLTSRRGLSVEQGIQALARAQAMLDENPAEGIKRIAQSYGVNLATLTGQQPSDVPNDPTLDLQAMVRQAVQPLIAPIQERFTTEDLQRQASIEGLVTEFATSPGHEHFDAVQDELMAMIPAIKQRNPFWSHQQILQDAYDRAVNANPNTRQLLREAERQKEEAARRAEAGQRAAKARTAATSVTGHPSGSQVEAPKGSLREEIEAAFAGAA